MVNSIYRIFIDKRVKHVVKRGRMIFSLRSFRVVVSKMFGFKILKLIKKRSYSLLRQMIDMYKDEIVTNFS